MNAPLQRRPIDRPRAMAWRLPITAIGSRVCRAVGIAALSVVMVGCASVAPPGGSAEPPPRRAACDPFESLNRAVFSFNDTIDRAVLRPVAKAYVDFVHPGVRQIVRNFFGNLGDVWTAANQLLQGKPDLAASDAARVVINTVFGFGGIADIASEAGLEKHREDFGQTLGRWGVGSGPYVVLPIFGPSSLRDAPAFAADLYVDPLDFLKRDRVFYSMWSTRIVDRRAELLPADRLLEGAALDRYSFVRDGYLQRRRSLVWDGNPPDDDFEPCAPADRSSAPGLVPTRSLSQAPAPGHPAANLER